MFTPIAIAGQLILQTTVVIFCWFYLCEQNSKKAGWPLIVGLTLMLVRRAFSIFDRWPNLTRGDQIDAWLAFTLSALMVYGWVRLYREQLIRRRAVNRAVRQHRTGEDGDVAS